MYYTTSRFLCQEERSAIRSEKLDRYLFRTYTAPYYSMKQFLAVIIACLFLITAQHAVAAPTPTPTCVPVFGGGTSCVREAPVVVNTQVRDPETGKFVDNLAKPYNPGDTVTFHIFVTNISNDDLKNIVIKDTFPMYLSYTGGDGQFDFNKQVFTADVSSLNKGQSKAISLTGTVVSSDKIPATPAPFCTTNISTASQGGKTSTDTTPFCLNKAKEQPSVLSVNTTSGSTRNAQPGSTTKGGLPIYQNIPAGQTKRTPDTGPEDIAYLAMAVPAIGGWFLRRKTAH